MRRFSLIPEPRKSGCHHCLWEIGAARPKFGDSPDKFASFAEKPGAKPRQPKKEREQKPIEPPGQRKANVWMAPGARPIGAGRAATEKAEVDAKRAARKSTYGKPAGGRPRGDRPEGGRPDGDGPKGPRKGGDRADRRR